MEDIDITSLENANPDNLFGSSIDLILNTNTDNKYGSSSLKDINSLDFELNELMSQGEQTPAKPEYNYNGRSEYNTNNIFKDVSTNNNTTWDGYQKYQNLGDRSAYKNSNSSSTTPAHLEKATKLKLLNKFKKYKKKKIDVSKDYTLEDDLDEMLAEDNAIEERIETESSVKFNMIALKYIINTIESGNKYYDAFGIDLDGWSDSIEESEDTLQSILEELVVKYKDSFKYSPEIKLGMHLIGSGVVIAITNRMVKNSGIPGMDEVLKQNPELARAFQQAAINTISNTSGADSNTNNGNFLSNIGGFLNGMNPNKGSFGGASPGEHNLPMGNFNPTSFNPTSQHPPRPVEQSRQFSVRPDLARAFNNDGVSLQDNNNIEQPSKAFSKPTNNSNMPIGSIPLGSMPHGSIPLGNMQQQKRMKGPSSNNEEINNLLSGIKTKSLTIPTQPPQQPKVQHPFPLALPQEQPKMQPHVQPQMQQFKDTDSNSEVSDIEDITSVYSSSQAEVNKKRRGRPKGKSSSRNTISLTL